MNNKQETPDNENRLVPTTSNQNNEASKGVKRFTDKMKNVFRKVEKGGEIYSKAVDGTTKLVEAKRDIEVIKAQTKIELSKIDKAHEVNMAIINNEYGKQAKGMDIAENIVNKGLEDDDLNKIALGLHTITDIANHNPLEKFQKNLDNDLKELNKGMDDEDYIIEI